MNNAKRHNENGREKKKLWKMRNGCDDPVDAVRFVFLHAHLFKTTNYNAEKKNKNHARIY